MASAFAKYEDSTLRKVLAVTLDAATADAAASPPVVHLAALAEELAAEAGDGGAVPLLLSQASLERALMARLSDPPTGYPQWPVHYLMGCYARAADEQRNVAMLRDEGQRGALAATLALCRQLAVSYAGLTLLMGMFPQPQEAEKRGALQLLDALDAAAAASSSALGFTGGGSSPAGGSSAGGGPPGGAPPMPPGFLEDFGARFEDEGLADLAAPIVAELMRRAGGVSLLGEFGGAIGLYARLAASPPFAKAITQLPAWLPAQQDGRTLERFSVLGPLFGISCTQDLATVGAPSRRLPDVAQQCFSGAASRRPQDLKQSMQNLALAAKQLRGGLHQLVKQLLKKDTREAMVGWLAAALNSNLERCKMRPDPARSATDGFMLNLAGVLLKLSEPFLDPLSGKAWGRVDARYACDPSARLLHSADDTRLNAESEEVKAWFAAEGPPQEGYSFICECFFMTARALQLGLGKGIDTAQNLARTVRNWEQDIEALRRGPLAAGPQAQLAEARLDWLKCAEMALEACLQDPELLGDALAFHRLSAAYMLRLASPAAAAGGPPSLPLPDPPAKEFCVLPEYFVEDLAELLLFVGHVRPDLVEARRMEEFMVFFTTFLGAERYLKNAGLRGKMVQALHSYMPPEASERQRYRVPASAAEVATLFEVHPLVVQHIVRSLIQLYIDIEITDRHNTFYEKFNTRYQIGEILTYLWALPQHRASWRSLAARQPKLHVQFIHVLLNDSQYLLQDALETLPKVQETERLQADAAAWAALSPQEREERESTLQSQQNMLQSDFYLASIIVRLMQLTAEDREVASSYFDAAVRNRTAKINDFFLKYLTVPEERRRLRIKDPEKYNWHPKRLITQLAQIHLCLYRARRDEWVQAVAADTDYYGRAPQLFSELLSLLRELGLLPPDDVAELGALVAAVEQYKSSVEQEEEAFEDIPEEFEDPLLGGLMRDPVRLPSGNVVERSSIAQQLLSDPRDPYSRQRCTEEDLEPLSELKARIEAWVHEQRSKRMATG